MTRIWERLYIGSLADAEELADGNPDGITTVLSLSEIPVEARREDITYLHLPVEDDAPVPVRQFYAVMDAMRKSIRWGTVLLHCSQGVSRAPSFAAAYMNTLGYKGIDYSITEIRRLRPFISPSRVLLKSVKENLR